MNIINHHEKRKHVSNISSAKEWVSEWISLTVFLGIADIGVPPSPYKPCNHKLYIDAKEYSRKTSVVKALAGDDLALCVARASAAMVLILWKYAAIVLNIDP